MNNGEAIFGLAEKLFPICRSITGDGVRKTLQIIQKHIPIKIYEVPSGTRAYDWTVPKEWNIKDAYVMDKDGNRIIDYNKNNLHVVGYSIPINKTIKLKELDNHLYSLPERPDAIPYVTSYYKEEWGFCVSHNDRRLIRDDEYHVYIDSELKDGSMTYAEIIIPGREENEIFFSTYVCHPSMANNEISGPSVLTEIVKWLLQENRRYTYRVIFIPETIGSIYYISRNLSFLKEKMVAGFNVTCVGDNGPYSYIPTRYGNTYADKIIQNVFKTRKKFIKYSFLDRGSDERQYNSPGIDLPVCTITRSKFHTYPEYHTSDDNLNFISPEGLNTSYEIIKECVELIENNHKYKTKCLAEPFLSKRNLYSYKSIGKINKCSKILLDFMAYVDSKNDIIDICNLIDVPLNKEIYSIVNILVNENLVEIL